ncbi:glycoside hydrolase family 29 protein [Plicaturopsis crispa FD-325 SS-3]|nr:glycoside hydrolase family 29 protein [Plicaturopsis crispa FD-325 SS-3]
MNSGHMKPLHGGIRQSLAYSFIGVFIVSRLGVSQAPSGQYAEWYDWDQHIPDNPTYAYHEKTYGKDFVYDDFIANFTASKFNASSWLDLFDNAGAKYFVSVTKHHDGFALFDTGNTTGRSSVCLGPKRDLLAELFETAQQEKPEIHRGTYYSLPEWYNPDYAKYGFSSWPGGLAHNAYNSSEIEPYTGRINISDYLEDLQLPHMLTLAEKYGSEIMWCDIGGPNKMLDFSAAYYNNALAKGLQVTVNNRCGAVPDFDTPEYATYSSVQTRKWETSEGMDPYSYGLNKATNASEYKNGTTIIQTLVDIVAKNGNYLLDIGPTAEGEIIAPMANNLLDAGEWLKYAGDCVYSTDYWYQTSQNSEPEDTPVRFLTTPNTFCIVALSKPGNGQLVVSERLPVLPGDEIFLLGPHNGSSLPWSFNDDATQLTINVSESDLDAVDYAWAFQVRYSGNELIVH